MSVFFYALMSNGSIAATSSVFFCAQNRYAAILWVDAPWINSSTSWAQPIG
jgi:hypothetical protein